MSKSYLHRRESLILAAVEVMNELGIQGLSTREIAKRQGVSEATLFRHFKNKNELLLELLNHYSQYDSDIIKSIKLKKLPPIESIIYFVEAYATYYENYPEITVITQSYDVLSSDPNLSGKVKEIFDSRRQTIKELIERAQNEGEIPSHINAEKLVDVIKGTFHSICLKWRLNGYNFSLKEETLATLKIILEMLGQKQQKGCR